MTIPTIIIDLLIQAAVSAVRWVIRLFQSRRQKKRDKERLRKIASAAWSPLVVRLDREQVESLKRRMP